MKKQKKPIPPADAEPVIKKQPLLKQLLFGPEKPDLSELEAGSTTILDILSPTAIDMKSRDYIVVDGVFHAYLYITGYGYSTTVGSCWLAPLVEAGEGVNISFSFTRQNREKILSKIAQTTMLNRSRMRDVGDTRQDYEELDSAITSGLYLKDVMNRQGEDFYYMHTLIEVVADDPDTLEQRVTAVEKLCISADMIARRCDYANEQGFLSALPLVALDADIERKSRRNALTTGVAAAFPFVSYEHSDRNGIFLGLNLYNKSPVFLDPYDDYKYTNGNWWIGGNSGAGKSVTLQCLAGRLREQGKRVVCVIPKKGHEFRPNCEQLGGLYLRLSPSSRDCPNIMAIRRRTLDAYAGIQELAARDDSVLADKISRLIIWYSLQKKDLTEEDKNYLDTSLVECYDRYGITFDNASVVDENGAFKEMPIIPDWYNVLLERAETKHLAVVLTRYVTGSAAAMGRRNHISIDNKYIGDTGDCAEPDNFYSWVAVDEDERVVDHLIMRYTGGDHRQLRFGWVIVDDTLRGKGYGQQMLRLGLRYAFELLQAEVVTIGVLEGNEAARQFYRKVGFLETGLVQEGDWMVVEMRITNSSVQEA